MSSSGYHWHRLLRDKLMVDDKYNYSKVNVNSDLASAKSDLLVVDFEGISTLSDLVAARSDLFNSYQAAIAAFTAMDTANVSDLVVGIGEILSALSDALPYI